MSHSPEEIKKHVKIYTGVFITLLVMTLVTVAVSYMHLPITLAVGLALVIALFKGSLVAGFFMHLFQEKPVIFWILVSAISLFFVLLIIPSIK